MKKFLNSDLFGACALTLAGLAVLGFGAFSAPAHAGEFNIGLNAGYSSASDSSVTEDRLYNGSLYGQYVFDGGFGLEGGYTYIGGIENYNADDAYINGPYLAASINSSLGQTFDVYARAGAMYAMTEGDVSADQRVAPFLGLGVQCNFTNFLYGRLGYDHYFNAARSDELETDIDTFYAGLGFKF